MQRYERVEANKTVAKWKMGKALLGEVRSEEISKWRRRTKK